MMSMNNFSSSSSSPSYPARQSNSQYSPYVSPSVRQQGQRFNYYAPSPYPRPRSSASKPNPSASTDINYLTADTVNDYYYRSKQSYSNNNYGNSQNDTNGRFDSSYNNTEYGTPSSEYFSCTEDSFMSPMSSISPHVDYQSSGYTGTSDQQYSSYFNAGFSGSPNKQPVSYQGSGYAGTPVQQQQQRRGYGLRKFSQGRNGISATKFATKKRGATAGLSYQGSGLDGNTMQNPPAKKPRVSVRCEICNIDFTSTIPYQMHLVGAKHLKKVKSKEVLVTMETRGQAPQTTNNYFYCEHCQVMANSSQQLQMHLDGTKHKNKMRKLTEPEDGDKTSAKPKDDNSATDETGPKPAKMAKFYCDVCSLSLNSEIQLSQHLTSKRHEAKVKGEPYAPKKKPRKFTDEPTNGSETSDAAVAVAPALSETTNATEKSGSATHKTYGVQELGSSFISGGVLQ